MKDTGNLVTEKSGDSEILNTVAFKEWYEAHVWDIIEPKNVVRLYCGLREIDKLGKNNDASDYLFEETSESALVLWDADDQRGDLSPDEFYSKYYKEIIPCLTIDSTVNAVADEVLISTFERGFKLS